MPLKLMYITNNARVAQIAENNSVDRIWVDLEKKGKCKRQAGMNTVQSTHEINDVSKIRNTLKKAELLVRINSMNDESEKEINEVIERGAEIIMLPYFTRADEVKQFLGYVDGRAKTMILLETIGAEKNIEEILKLQGINEVHIGLNDLHIQYRNRFMFELLSNGKVEEICNHIRKFKIPYGFGGVARLDEGLLPARHIIAEHYRLGSTMAILSRSFYDTWLNEDYEEIERVFKYGISEIREYEKRLETETMEFFENNRITVKREVDTIVQKMVNRDIASSTVYK